jgi:hypothetical protein
MKQFLVFLALLVIIGLVVIAFSAKGSFTMTGSVAPEPASSVTVLNNNSAAAQKARADDAMQQAQQLQANAHAAGANETAQAQSASSALSLSAQATVQALAVAGTQIAMNAAAANFPSTQSAIFAQQTAQALRVQATSDASALLVAQQQTRTNATAQAVLAQQTVQAFEVQGTINARAALLVQQQSQTTATSQAMAAMQTSQALAAQTTAQAMQLEGVAAVQAAGNSQRQNVLMGWLVPLLVAIVLGVALFLGAIFILGLIATAKQKRIQIIQKFALPSRLVDTPTETIVFVDDPQTGFPTPQLLYTHDNDQSYDASSPLDGATTMIDTQARVVNENLFNDATIMAGQAEIHEDAARHKLAMKLIRDAINHLGAQSNRIPPAAQLGWLAGAWTNAVAILRPYGVEILPGEDGGTYLMGQFPTLHALYLAIGESHLPHFPPSAGSIGNG